MDNRWTALQTYVIDLPGILVFYTWYIPGTYVVRPTVHRYWVRTPWIYIYGVWPMADAQKQCATTC